MTKIKEPAFQQRVTAVHCTKDAVRVTWRHLRDMITLSPEK